MQSSILFQRGAVLAPVFLTFLGAPSFAQTQVGERAATAAIAPDARSATPVFTADSARTSVLYDEPGDGDLWAVGSTWKASFGPRGAVYFPRVGSKEPRSLPLALSPDLVAIGGEPLAFARTVEAVRDGDRIELDRGAFTERYDLELASVEQSFVFDSLPRAGDLVLRIPVASELDAVETSAGLEFRGEHGRVTYSRAVVVDARGRRTDAATRIEDGAITIRVDADVLADAALPIVVDPILNAIYPDSSTDDTLSPDAAYDAFHGVWVVTYEDVFSATDHDVYVKSYTGAGTFIATATIDFTANSWIGPRIADLASVHGFLVVAGVTASVGGVKSISGRIVQPNGTILTTDPQISISGGTSGDCILPDVGGDTSGAPGNWLVVFERDLSSSDRRIGHAWVRPDNVVVGPAFFTPPAGSSEGAPSVSKSRDGGNWLLAWEHFDVATQQSIRGGFLTTNGLFASGPFLVGPGPNVSDPCASSPISGTSRAAIVYQSGLTVGALDSTIMVALVEGGTVVQLANLMTLENSSTAAQDQIQPSIDSDGQHFLVAYSEVYAPTNTWEVYLTDLAASGDSLLAVQTHVPVFLGTGLSQLHSNVAASRATGTTANQYLVVCDVRQSDTNHDISGRFFQGYAGGTWSPFCFGDGTGVPCPCGNSGGIGRGCANSQVISGARIVVSSGDVSTVTNDAVVQVGGLPINSTCLLFQGTNSGTATAFGDGLRCVTGSVVRLGTKVAPASSIVYFPGAGDPPLSSAGGVPVNGGLRTYQAWYRNAANFCTSATFNLSSGVVIQWAR